jgi:hypothetical protein
MLVGYHTTREVSGVPWDRQRRDHERDRDDSYAVVIVERSQLHAADSANLYISPS